MKTYEPVDPEYILWGNIGYTKKSQKLRRAFSVSVAAAIIVSSMFLVDYVKRAREAAEAQHLGPSECEHDI